jgi:hypothetical protein
MGGVFFFFIAFAVFGRGRFGAILLDRPTVEALAGSIEYFCVSSVAKVPGINFRIANSGQISKRVMALAYEAP